MSNDSPPGSSRPPAGGEFTWPPTREELDAIDVIPLDDSSLTRPTAVVPAKAMAAPAIGRRGRLRLPLRLPRRDDLVLAGVVCTSVLAIAVAASMQFSDVWRPAPEQAVEAVEAVESLPLEHADRPIAPLIAQALPAMAPLAMSPVATAPPSARPVAHRRIPASQSARSARYARYARDTGRSARYTGRAASTDYAGPRLISPERGRSGKLVLLVQVRKNGKVGDVNVLSSNLDRENRSHRDLQRAAISTVKRWRYTPAIRDGEPADTQVRVVVDINLDSGVIGSASEADARRRAAATNRAVDSVRAAR
jgi:protein TonB